MYNGFFSNYATWNVYNYISNNENEYFKVVTTCANQPNGKPVKEIIYELKNELEDDFKKPGIIDINESERAGLYAEILDDAISEIDFMDIAKALYQTITSK